MTTRSPGYRYTTLADSTDGAGLGCDGAHVGRPRRPAQRHPWHYAKWWDAAVEVVAAISGEAAISDLLLEDDAPCAVAGDATGVSLEGWANPAVGSRSSGFGPRNTGIPGASRYHLGQDIANDCRTPLYAAAAVTASGLTSYGNVIAIDHGQGAVTRYLHVLTGSLMVDVRDQVQAGQQIGGMGGDKDLDPKGVGTSSGCHLHFEVIVNGEAIDPMPFMSSRGVNLGSSLTPQGSACRRLILDERPSPNVAAEGGQTVLGGRGVARSATPSSG